MMNTVYTYTNNMGRAKELWVANEPKEDGTYFCVIWDMATGENCGTGDCTKEQIEKMLKNMKNVVKKA